MISETTIFRHAAACKTSRAGDSIVLYQAKTEKVHHLNPTAAMVYELCGAGKPLGEIARSVQIAFSLPEPPISDVWACVERFAAEGLIEACK
jgi:hypothetical protein